MAVDDVGADSMSLAFLPLLRPDVVKLDLRLVQERPGPAIAEIMNAVNAHAERTGAVVLAEGIETEEHLVMARALGATLGQGWLFGRPGPGAAPGCAPASWPARRRRRRAEPDASPFGCLPASAPLRRSPKALLIELSKQLEREAMRLGETGRGGRDLPGGPPLHAVDHPALPRPGRAHRLRLRARRGSAGRAAARAARREPGRRRRGARRVGRRRPRPALQRRAARPRPRGRRPGPERTFEYALTYDRATVVRAAHALLSRVAPRVGARRRRSRRRARPSAPARRRAAGRRRRAAAHARCRRPPAA